MAVQYAMKIVIERGGMSVVKYRGTREINPGRNRKCAARRRVYRALLKRYVTLHADLRK